MKRKGIISVILCMALIFTSVMPAFALVSKFESPQYIYNVKFDDLTFVAETEEEDGYFKNEANNKVFATKVAKHADLEIVDSAEGANKYAKIVVTPGEEETEQNLNNTNCKLVMPETGVKNLAFSYDVNFDEIAANAEEDAKDTELYAINFKGEVGEGNSYKWMSSNFQGISFYAKPDGTPYIKSKTVTRNLEKEKWYTVTYVFSAIDGNTYDVYIKERDNTEAETVVLADDAASVIKSITQIETAGHKTASATFVDNFKFECNEMCVVKEPATDLDIAKDKLQFTAFVHQGVESAQVKLGGVLVDTINCEEGDNGYYLVDVSLASVANQLCLGENTLTIESGDAVYAYDKPITLAKNVESVLNSHSFDAEDKIDNITSSTQLKKETGTLGVYPKAVANEVMAIKNGPAKKDTSVSNALYYYNPAQRNSNKSSLQINPSDEITEGVISLEFNAYAQGSKTLVAIEPRTVADSKVTHPETQASISNKKYCYFPTLNAATINVVSTSATTFCENKTPTNEWVNIRVDIDVNAKKVNYYENGEYLGFVPYEYYTHYSATSADFIVDTTARGIDYINIILGSEGGGQPEVYLDDVKLTVYTPYPEIEEVSYTNYGGSVIKSEGNVDTTAQNIILTMSDEVANVSKDTVILREKGGEAVEADVDVNGEKIYVKPINYLTYGKTYEIELTGDVKFGENAYGAKQKTEFTAVAETGILSPSDGEKIANTDTIEIIALTPDADKAEFYIDNNLVGDAVPNEDGIAAVNVDTKELTLGRKALKVIAYTGAEYETAYSSFYITNEVIYSPNGVLDFETTDAYKGKIAVAAQSSANVSFAESETKAKADKKSLEIKVDAPTATNKTKRLFYQASFESNNMKTGTVVLDHWVWINKADELILEMDAFADMSAIPEGYTAYTDAACTTAITKDSQRRQYIKSGISIIGKGKYGNTDKTYDSDDWRHIVIKYNIDTRKLEVYTDDILCYESETLKGGMYYYMKDAEGNIVCDEGTETATKFDMKNLPTDRMYFIRINYYDNHTAVAATSEQAPVLYIDNVYAYNELPIPQVDGVTYKAGETVNVDMEKAIIDKAATEIELSLTSKLEASTVTANTVKMYVNGEAATYDNVSYADQKIKIAKADGFKENDKIEIVLEDSIKFLGNKAAIGQKVSTLLYVAKNGLFIDTDIEVKGGKIYAWFDALNAEDDAKSVFVIFAAYDGDKMLKCDVTSVEVNDKASTVLDVNADGAKTAKIMVMSDDSNIEPLINAKEATISE